MASALRCPSCDEQEDLTGTPRGEDILVTCGVCGAQWLRGGLRCATCGRADLVERPQAMTRYSRGTQLSIIGWRQLPLCPHCDAQALQASLEGNQPVPASYVAAALHPGQDTRPAAARPPQWKPEPALPPVSPPPPTAAPPSASDRKAPPRTRRSLPPQPKADPATVPTVRQAIQAFLTQASGDVDHTAMLLLGTHLGSAARLSVLDEADAAQNLAAWFARVWQDRDAQAAQRSRETLCRAADFWGAHGWLTSDPAARLRH
ncbi:hypothetical protein [Streptomyces sp. YIM 98790]|uniref:hypothetical protein n=1 Tax=Streptomyces sp. YIM 98790 TaxID=2689077 RepID=UPI0014088A28|nr:hypothetical protein [Streptomyces sp. YIM 98790]